MDDAVSSILKTSENTFLLLHCEEIKQKFSVDIISIHENYNMLFNETPINRKHYDNFYWNSVRVPSTIAKILAIILTNQRYTYPYRTNEVTGRTEVYHELISNSVINNYLKILFKIFYDKSVSVKFTNQPDISKFNIFNRTLEIYGEVAYLLKIYIYPSFTAYKLYTKEGEYLKQGMDLSILLNQVKDHAVGEYIQFLTWN